MPKNEISLKTIYEIVQRIEDKIEKNYVSKARFQPVERIVYGFVSLILITVGSLIVSSVVKAYF